MKRFNITYRPIIVIWLLALASFANGIAFAQNQVAEIDPRLIEVVQTVKEISEYREDETLRGATALTESELISEKRLGIITQMKNGAIAGDPVSIMTSVEALKSLADYESAVSLDGVIALYSNHAKLLERDADREEYFKNIDDVSQQGNWFEGFSALALAELLYSENAERNAAMQKAQSAFALIPQGNNDSPYARYAIAETTNTLARLHNIQGNVELALDSSLAYLALPKVKTDPRSAVDIVNNLIFSHSLKRDHKSLVYLSEAILEIEKTNPSSLPGLSELRISQAMNASIQFERALEYSDIALEKIEHSGIKTQAIYNRAIALAGLNRISDAKEFAEDSGINLNEKYLLETETRRDALYLGFLLAQSEDRELATALYNRQLDVTSQKFLENNSRDTTAMLADLENSRERQAEREKASAREAELQAMTIDRQRNLNRLLILLTFILSGVAIGSFLFMKSREKLMRKLEIKTVEAASAEKLKTEFLGMISHELRTPLNGIIGISDFLANYHDDPDIRKKTGIVLRSGNELLAVVESLTDMARLDAGQLALSPHDTDLSLSLSAVPEMWTEKAKDKDLAFTHFIDPAIGTHAVDEDRLIQCLNILMANAISFTHEGRVHLHITGKTDQQGDVTGLTAIVADTGQGMSELVQSRLFTPFMQADTSRKRTHMGTGLSLAIAYALADMMGGELSVISREGRGSEFKLDVPLNPATGELPKIMTSSDEISGVKGKTGDLSETVETDISKIVNEPLLDVPVLESTDAPKREVIDLMQPRADFPSLHDLDELVLPTPAEGRQRILVVDDVDSNRDILRLILESQGHSCSEAADGFAALAMLDGQSFDLIVLDIHMTPLDGVETLRRLRDSEKAYANMPVIALTADNAASTNAACMDAGADLFLTKPVKQEELLRAISYLRTTEGARILSR